jgi:aminoglycoside phosphotransferase (APT) family kinase protein
MNVKWNDKAITTRAREGLAISKLKACLLDHLPNVSGSMKVKQFPGGYSNLTYLISMGDTEYVLRRPPVGAKVKSGHDMGREYRILCGLKFVNHKVPAPFYYSEDLTREEIIHQYELKTGRTMEYPIFYYVHGLLKIAVIIQQIYYRYQQGLTQDPRFASLPTAIKQISLIAEQAIKKNKIDNLI